MTHNPSTENVDLLNDIAEFLEPQMDVVDGSYGEPHANRAMQLHQRVEEEIARIEFMRKRPDPLSQALNEGDGSYKP